MIVPVFSKLLTENIKEFKKLFQNTLYILAGAGLIVLVIGWVVSPLIIGVLGGEEFVLATSVLRFLLAATLFIFVGTLLGQTIILLGAQKKAAWAYGFGAIFNIATNLIFIPRYSYFGAAATTVATEILVTAALLIITATVIRSRLNK